MKLKIKTLYGFNGEVTIKEADPTIREIRDTIAKALGRTWDVQYPVINLENNLKVIFYLDSDPSETLSRLIAKKGVSMNLPEEILCCCVTYLSPLNRCEPSYYNPSGLGIEGMEDLIQAQPADTRNFHLAHYFPNEDQQEFVRSLVNEHGLVQKNYANRFSALNLEDSVIPDNFHDPITQEIMNSPVVCSDQYIYDRSTLSKLPVSQYSRLPISPFTNRPIKVIAHAIKIHAEMELFLKPREQALHQNSSRSLTK